jgi:16S rRNA (uracil1498-N3)-methyltransferase
VSLVRDSAEGAGLIRIPRVYHTGDIRADEILLEGDSAHYVAHVLRGRTGLKIEVFDGKGTTRQCEISGMSKTEIRMAVIEENFIGRRSPLNLTVALNPLKGGNEDVAIRMAAAMDAIAIWPLIYRRSEVPFDTGILAKRIDRWRRLCISEVALSQGAWLPEIFEPEEFGKIEKIEGTGVIFDEEADAGTMAPVFEAGSDVTAFIGPEGGLEREEVANAVRVGCKVASLGNWTLRAELAGALVPLWCYTNTEK